MVVWVVVFEGEVFVLEVEDALHVWVDSHLWQWAWLTCELQLGLLDMVEIEMGVACGVDKITCLESCDLCYHHEKQGLGCDVERHSEECVGTSLIELEAESSVCHIELEEDVAWREIHVPEVSYVPRTDDESA